MTKKADLHKQWEIKEKAKQQKLLDERLAKEALEQKKVSNVCFLYIHLCSLLSN